MLTPQQRTFLDKYVSQRNFLTSVGKKKRAKSFAGVRDKLQSALMTAPPGLPGLPKFIQDMRMADALGEQLKFNRASEAMESILRNLSTAMQNYQPLKDPKGSFPVDGEKVEKLQVRMNMSLTGSLYQDPQVQVLAKELELSIKRVEHILGQETVKLTDFNQAESLVEEIEGKLGRLVQHAERIRTRKKKLEKYLKLAEQRDDINSTDGFVTLQKEVRNLLSIDEWSSIEESTGTALHLKLMLALADGKTQQKDLKKGEFEMVLAVKRKESSSDEPNYKMIVKPVKFEIPVEGFKRGGGAPREALGSFLGDELQRQLGFNLRVPETRIITMQGRDMSGDSVEKEKGMHPSSGQIIDKVFGEDEKVVTSVQTYEDGCEAISKLANEKISPEEIERRGNGCVLDQLVSKREIQQVAVFDLIALHMDRHSGNMLVSGGNKLVPIDHGNILPTKIGLRKRTIALGVKKAVIRHTAASKEMLSPDLLERIKHLDIDQLIASMQDQQEQMKIENDGIDVDDLNAGLANVRRSSEFLKFAVKELTLDQIYAAYEELQDLIFFSEEEDKKSSFRAAVENMKTRMQSRGMLELFLGVGPETPNQAWELAKRVLERMKELGWFLDGSRAPGSAFPRFLHAQPGRCLEIISKAQKSGLSASLKERYRELGGRRAAIWLGYATDSKDVKMGEVNNEAKSHCPVLELYYATTGKKPFAG